MSRLQPKLRSFYQRSVWVTPGILGGRSDGTSMSGLQRGDGHSVCYLSFLVICDTKVTQGCSSWVDAEDPDARRAADIPSAT